MYETKLAQSIQNDYRQAADAYRFRKTTVRKSSRLEALKLIVIVSLFVTVVGPLLTV